MTQPSIAPASTRAPDPFLDREFRVARLRAVGAAMLAVCLFAGFLFPRWAGLRNLPATAALLLVLWSAAALGLWAALRSGWYRGCIWFAAPAVDALALAGTFALLWRFLDYWGGSMPRGTVVAAGMLCVPLAMSGGFRPTRRAALLPLALAVLVFAFVARAAELEPLYIAVSLAALALASGLATELAVAAPVPSASVASEPLPVAAPEQPRGGELGGALP